MRLGKTEKRIIEIMGGIGFTGRVVQLSYEIAKEREMLMYQPNENDESSKRGVIPAVISASVSRALHSLEDKGIVKLHRKILEEYVPTWPKPPEDVRISMKALTAELLVTSPAYLKYKSRQPTRP